GRSRQRRERRVISQSVVADVLVEAPVPNRCVDRRIGTITISGLHAESAVEPQIVSRRYLRGREVIVLRAEAVLDVERSVRDLRRNVDPRIIILVVQTETNAVEITA